jgi:hypothetical protein|tara:strand:- start:282 stop:473 length:192 start_codon:yes stop_codon:yes gene_type:complete
MKPKKRIFEIFDKKSGKVIRAVGDDKTTPSRDKLFMYDYVIAQIEVFTTMDDMELGVCFVEKN